MYNELIIHMTLISQSAFVVTPVWKVPTPSLIRGRDLKAIKLYPSKLK